MIDSRKEVGSADAAGRPLSTSFWRAREAFHLHDERTPSQSEVVARVRIAKLVPHPRPHDYIDTHKARGTPPVLGLGNDALEYDACAREHEVVLFLWTDWRDRKDLLRPEVMELLEHVWRYAPPPVDLESLIKRPMVGIGARVGPVEVSVIPKARPNTRRSRSGVCHDRHSRGRKHTCRHCSPGKQHRITSLPSLSRAAPRWR